MPRLTRRSLLKTASAAAFATQIPALTRGSYTPGNIPNEYSLFLPGERESLAKTPPADRLRTLEPGAIIDGWELKTAAEMNGTPTWVFEKRVAHQGAIVYITEEQGVILRIPKRIGRIENIRPRQIDTPHGVKFTREVPYVPGPDRPGIYILNSNQDPRYENVAALGPEYIGWTLVANEQAGPLRSLYLDSIGKSRQLENQPEGQGLWAPDLAGALFDPAQFLSRDEPSLFQYIHGYSKRTLLGGYLPIANIGLWNPEHRAGYEVIVLLPNGEDAEPVARITVLQDGRADEHFWQTDARGFYSELAGIANCWQHLFEDHMKVEIPDQWLLDAARAGITLTRCSYRGLRPTYQIGEGAYTKIPERSHALFPVAHYEFVWAHQLWNLTDQVEPYFEFYLNNYILPNGNFLYNTQDQVEAPLNTGVFLWNSARAYDYTRDIDALNRRLPVLRRMISYVLARYEYSKNTFSPDDRRYGLIWGSPEADLGDPHNDFPNSHPYYFQNAAWTWRGLKEHARCLDLAGREHNLPELADESKRLATIAAEMRGLIQRSIDRTIAAEDLEMRESGITPFNPFDTHHKPTDLESYENHRFMMDWFTADWGDPALDLGHLKHRELAGEQIMGLHTDGHVARTSNFMEHGSLAVKIRQDDYRPFLLTLYALCCYTADCGSRYSPEDAFIPGSYPGEGQKYDWSAVVNSALQPALGLRWLLCYEESDRDLCHLQKAAPKHWFGNGSVIHVQKCPTRFGQISWRMTSSNGEWSIALEFAQGFAADLAVHIHPPDQRPLKTASIGKIQGHTVLIPRADLQNKRVLTLTIH